MVGELSVSFQQVPKFRICTGNGRVERKKFLASKHINIASKNSHQGCHLAYLEARFDKSGLFETALATDNLSWPPAKFWLNFGLLNFLKS